MTSRRVCSYLQLPPRGRDYFREWRDGLDRQTVSRVNRALNQVAAGVTTNVRRIHSAPGVYEIRIQQRPGYRVYFAYDGNDTIALFRGGTKRTQNSDIDRARDDYSTFRERKEQGESETTLYNCGPLGRQDGNGDNRPGPLSSGGQPQARDRQTRPPSSPKPPPENAPPVRRRVRPRGQVPHQATTGRTVQAKPTQPTYRPSAAKPDLKHGRARSWSLPPMAKPPKRHRRPTRRRLPFAPQPRQRGR